MNLKCRLQWERFEVKVFFYRLVNKLLQKIYMSDSPFIESMKARLRSIVLDGGSTPLSSIKNNKSIGNFHCGTTS